MTIKRVQEAAARRGMRFNGKKQWLNNIVGNGYSVYHPYGAALQADTLTGLYTLIMKYPRIESN